MNKRVVNIVASLSPAERVEIRKIAFADEIVDAMMAIRKIANCGSNDAYRLIEQFGCSQTITFEELEVLTEKPTAWLQGLMEEFTDSKEGFYIRKNMWIENHNQTFCWLIPTEEGD